MSKNDRNSNAALFLAGLVAGGAAAYFLNTPRGKRVRNVMLETADQMSTDVRNKAMDVVSTVKTKADEAVNAASSALTNAKQAVVGGAEDVVEEGEEQLDDFQSGVNKAKNHIENRINS